jgi:molecular chaperone GrpE
MNFGSRRTIVTTDAFGVTVPSTTTRTTKTSRSLPMITILPSKFRSSIVPTTLFVGSSMEEVPAAPDEIPSNGDSTEPPPPPSSTVSEVSSIPVEEETNTSPAAAEPAVNNVSSSSSNNNSNMDILNSPQFLYRKRDVLLNDLQTIQNDIVLAQERLRQSKDEWGAQIADLSKEYEMIQQRMNVQCNSNTDLATSQVVRSMLTVLDNFDRAFGQVTAQTDMEMGIEQEYRQVYTTILELFAKLGVQEVPTLGTEFNYDIHQAVMQKPSTEYSEGMVCEELQKGFQINNTLIRAAMVAVAM